jgi:hypothetical protein
MMLENPITIKQVAGRQPKFKIYNSKRACRAALTYLRKHEFVGIRQVGRENSYGLTFKGRILGSILASLDPNYTEISSWT